MRVVMRRRNLGRRLMFAFMGIVIVGLVGVFFNPRGDDIDDVNMNTSVTGRHLLVNWSIIGRDEPGDDGGLGGAGAVLWVALILFLFVGIAVVTDDYFVPALEKISEALDLSDDVAGATFLAAGSSAPEIFTSLVDTFIQESRGFGLGTIVGSAVFNILGIVAVSCIPGGANGQPLQLEWFPIARDATFYAVSLGLLVISIADYCVDWWEALVMVLVYLLYLISMKFSPTLSDHFKRCCSSAYTDLDVGNGGEAGRTSASRLYPRLSVGSQISQRSSMRGSVRGSLRRAAKALEKEEQLLKDEKEETEPTCLQFDPPEHGLVDYIMWAIALPWVVLFRFTVPDCQWPGWEKYYPVTFGMSILWIGFTSAYMVKFSSWLGELVNASEVVMGMIVLAAGSSVPDALGSYAVAKRGLADAAVSNAIGSNVINILIGLGVVWLIDALRKGHPVLQEETTVRNVMIPIFIVVGVLLLFLAVLLKAGAQLTSKVGFTFIALYGVFVLWIILNEFVFEITFDAGTAPQECT